MNAKISKLIAIVGPTATGKTALSLAVAKRFNGEIICADSRTIYRGLDIGTAKPSLVEQASVRHHLLDIADPNETVTVAQFKRLALIAVDEILARGKVPLLVGGSGLYVDSVLYNYQFSPAPTTASRRELQTLSLAEATEKLRQVAPDLAATIDTKNIRRVLRALETYQQPAHQRASLRKNTLIIGILPNKERMQGVIRARIDGMIRQGLVAEVAAIGQRFGWDCPALSGIGYRAFREVASGNTTIEQAAEACVQGDRRLVKKQMTWFKRNQDIYWITTADEGMERVEAFLQD